MDNLQVKVEGNLTIVGTGKIVLPAGLEVTGDLTVGSGAQIEAQNIDVQGKLTFEGPVSLGGSDTGETVAPIQQTVATAQPETAQAEPAQVPGTSEVNQTEQQQQL